MDLQNINWSKVPFEEVKEMMIKSGGWDQRDVDRYSPHDKSEMVAELIDYYNDDEIFEDESDDVDTNTPANEVRRESVVPRIPNYSSTEWNNYVLSLLEPDEVDQHGNPLLHGLRRLAELLLGEIVFSGVIQLQSDQDWSACNYKLEIIWKLNEQPYVFREGESTALLTRRVFLGAADAGPRNLGNRLYAKYPVAMAEARAEGRALRKALGIRCVTSEELDALPDTDMITSAQKNLITAKCSQLGVNISAFANAVVAKDLEKASLSDGAKMIQEIKNYQTNPQSIPQELLNESNV